MTNKVKLLFALHLCLTRNSRNFTAETIRLCINISIENGNCLWRRYIVYLQWSYALIEVYYYCNCGGLRGNDCLLTTHLTILRLRCKIGMSDAGRVVVCVCVCA